MALPLTIFETVYETTPPTPSVVYTAPTGYNAIVLTATVVNKNAVEQTFTLSCRRSSVDTAIVYQYPVPPNETLTVLGGGNSGTLVLNTGDSVVISGSSTSLEFSASFLGTLK